MVQKRRQLENWIKKLSSAVALSLFFLTFPAVPSNADIRQWDFNNAEDYQFDQKQIEVKDGNVRLLPLAPYRDAGAQSFQRGQFDLNTTVERGTLELASRGPHETAGPELPSPVGNREPGLAALWHADEPNGTNLLDSVGRTVAKASDTEVVSGQTGFGYARLFDGEKSFVFIPHYETLSLRGPFSIEAWIRPLTAKSSKPQTLISRWQTVGAQRGFALQISTEGNLDFLVSPDGATVTRQRGNSVLAEGVWQHVAAVFNGSDLRVYVNGALDSTPMPFSGPVYFADNPVYLGALVDNRVDQFYKGVIDEIAIYQRALTETETLTHFGNVQGLAGLWHLNERGGVITDASGYGLNGTAIGGVHYEAEGKMGAGVEISDRKAFVQIPGSSRLAPQGQMTLEAWVKPASFPGLGQRAAVLSIYEETGQDVSKGGSEVSLSLAGPDGRIAAYASRLQPSEVRGRISLTPGVWQHVAVTWSEGKVRIYNNGVLDTTASYTGSLDFVSKAALRMGTDATGTAAFQGTIDEAAIYRRARTDSEIASAAGLFMPYGIFTSEVKDAGGVAPWKSIEWKLPLPYSHENDGAEPGLLHIFHMNDPEGAGITNAKGEISASPIGTYPVPGVFGSARWFAGKGYDKILSQKDFPALSTFTISCWVEFSSGQAGLSDRVFSIGDGNPTVFRAADGRMRVQMQGAREIVGERIMGDSRWHHLALVADGRNLFLYIDGLLDGISPFMTASAQSPLVIGNLKSTDTFQGAVDEFLFYNYPLDRSAVMQQFLRGQMDAKMLVRSSDNSDFSNASWRGPAGPRLTENAGMFTAGLWHFDEKVFRGQPAEIQDAGNFANQGTAFGRVTSFADAVSGSAVSFNGSTDFIRASDSESLHPDKFTLSAWVRPEEMAEGQVTLVDKQFKAGAPVFSSFALDLIAGNRLAFRLGRPGGYRQIETGRDGEIAVGRWNHVAAVYDRKEVRLYINGKKVKTADFQEPVPYDDGPLYFGRYASGEDRYFRGALDEVHLLNTAASDDEIASRFAQANPENYFRPLEMTAAGVSPARYFQYRVLLSTQQPFISPAVSEVNLRSSAFPSGQPSISPISGISYAELSGFSDVKGRENAGTVTYQISPDGLNWFFHNGRRWVAASGAVESNTSEQIRNQINSFAREAGMGSFYFRAFLQSPTGAEPVSLENVQVEYLPNKLTVTSPNGGEAYLIGSRQVIRWNAAGEMKKVSIEYSKDGFRNDFHEIAKGIDNSGSFEWQVPDDAATGVKVRVMDSLDPRIYDMSDISFRITGQFELITPNSEERWLAGSSQKIVWKTMGKIPQVKLEYSTDGFEKTFFPIVDSLKNEGSYEWKVPDHTSRTVKVRVSDVRDPEVFDKSNDSFSITGGLGILSPQLGARWLTGSHQEIRWQSVGTIPLVNIEYFTSGRGDWVRIAENFESRGSYMWQVPDDIDGQVRIRVMDASDSRVVAESEPFALVGGLRLLNPKGGEQWTAGTRRKIAWETVGSIPAVNLEYKSGSDNSWRSIEETTANTGSYVWEVPSTINGPITVRVTDARDPFTVAEHASASKVIPGFHLLSPNGAEEWKIGTEQQISWETVGEAPQVRLEYSKDLFKSDIHEIIASASNLGSYTWTVPDDAAPETWVRVSDASNSAAQSTSNAPFRVYAGFEIQIPKGGEKFEVGSMATFVWNTLGTVPRVRLEYSHDNFDKDSRLIEASVPNEGHYTWTVPDDIGEGYYLKISDVSDPKTAAFSKEPFAVMGNFHLIYPVGGEDLIAGTVARIAWRGAGSVPVVRIDYSEDDFQKSFNTITDKAPNTGSYEWTVPNLIGRQFKIRVWDPSQPDSVDVMKSPARIVGGFRLVEPNGGEVLYVGDRVAVKWETSGTLPRVKLELSTDNFTRDISVVADSYPNNGQYDWLVPDAPSGRYKLRVSDPRDVTAFDISNSDFIIRSRFALQSPNGGEGWAVGEKRTIRWQTSAAVSQVRLDYTTNDFQSLSVIEKAVPNTGMYEWNVPDQVSGNVRLRVSDIQDSEAFDVSDAPFRIQGIFHLTSPNGGEVWKTGEQRAITWQTTGQIEGVRLEYSRDGFSSESRVITESTPNTGHFNWTVPDDVSAQAKVRVMDVKDFEVQDMSDQNFQIAGSFVVLAPNGGESWHASEKREITWMTVGTVKDISLDYSADDFKTHETIEHGLMNTGRYTWDVPDRLGENFKVRICDADNSNGCDFSDNVFAVRSPLEITAPRGGEDWLVGSNQEIRWNTYGTVRRVSVSYSSKPGIWNKLIEELPNEGHFLFRVPDDISREVFFKVTDYDNESLDSVTRAPLAILGSFDLISPDGGQKWAAGTTQRISWDTLGAVSNARLEYSFDDFKNNINLIESSIPNTGSYEWRVPPATGLTARIRISDADHPEAFDTSREVFKIMPGITVLSPNGGEQWTAGHKEKITWKTEGKSDWVRLEYSSGFQPAVSADDQVAQPQVPEWKLIADRVANGGYYEWVVPRENGTEYTVRVTDALDPDATDVSDHFFEVKPELILNHPAGKQNLQVGSEAQILWDTVGTVPFVKIEYSLDGFAKDIRPVADKAANEGKFIWTVPDTISDNAKIRVSSAGDALVRSVSPEAFKILPPFEMLTPSGIEKWTVGTEQTLKWDWRGTVETVKLEYSIDEFSSSSVLMPAAPNKGFFVWTVPDLAHAQVQIRVSDTRFPEASAVSKSVAVIPGFRVVSPAGGEKFETGTRQNLEWQTVGSCSKVKLEYGAVRDGVTVWKTIENVVRNTGRYEWKVPDDLSSQARVRVSDVLDSAASAQSPAPFKILGVFKILSPQTDELLRIGDRFQIRWETSGKVPSVKLDYSVSPDKPESFQSVEKLWENTGVYFWTVPDTASEKLWLRISDAAEPDAFKISEAPFKIRGSLGWDLPVEADGLNWPVGSLQTLKWNTVGTIPRINLEYTVDQKTWKKIASDIVNAGSFGWTIPDDTSKSVRLRISAPDLPVVSDVTERPLTISAQFQLLSPAAGEVWTVGSRKKIEWKTTGHVQKVWLQFMADGKKWQQLAGPLQDTGSYEWQVPDHISNDVKIRILDGDNDKAFAESPSFKIAGALEVLSPAGGEVWETGSRHEIRWNTLGTIPNVRVEAVEEPLNAGDSGQPSLVILEFAGNKGSFEWTVPDRISDRLKIRITDARDASVNASSAAPFSIIAHLEVKNPKAGDVWTVGSSHEIIWSVSGTVPAVRMEYSRDDFYREVNLIASDVPNTGVAMWTVPDTIDNAVKVRVSDARDARAFGLSEPFKVRGGFSFAKPESGQVWRVGSLQTVEWQTQGTIPSVRMEFSRDDFHKDIQVISNVHENAGSFQWAVPDAISNTLKLRISDERDASVYAVSSPIKVEGVLALKSPLGGERFQVLSTQKISWDTTGSISKVRVEYSKDDFNQDVHLITSDLKNEGSLDWLVPDDVADTLKIRVLDAGDFFVNSVSSSAFVVRGSLLMTTPSRGQRWAVGSEQEINWQTIGTIPQVQLEYSKDDFQADIQPISGPVVNTGNYKWKVPDDISGSVRVRVSDAQHPEVFSITSDPAAITGRLLWEPFSEPAVWTVGDTVVLNWRTEGTVPFLQLEYASLAGSQSGDWKLVSGALENQGQFSFTVPDFIHEKTVLRISDVRDPMTQQVSQPVSIMGRLKVMVPSAGERWIVGTPHDILWTTTGTVPSVFIEASGDGFKNDIRRVAADATANTGRWTWTVPDAVSPSTQVRVRDSRYPSVESLSPAFAVTGDLALRPIGEGDVWQIGREERISWDTVGSVPSVRIEYIPEAVEAPAAVYGPMMPGQASPAGAGTAVNSALDQGVVIVDRAANTGSYLWKVPENIPERIRLHVSNADDSQVSSQSREPIRVLGVLQVISPSAGQALTVGSPEKIVWKTTGSVPYVKLEFSPNLFAGDVRAVAAAPNLGSFEWTIPDAISDQAAVRVSDARDARANAISGPFKIQGSLNFQTPAAGTVLTVGQTARLQWQTSGSIPWVRLEYSRDSFKQDIQTAVERLENKGFFDFTLPDAISDKLQFRVADAADFSVYSVSQPVKVQGALRMKSLPSTVFITQSVQTLSWDTTGTIPKVRLEYSPDDFSQTIREIAASVPNDGHFDWNVPDDAGDGFKVRVSNASDYGVAAVSPSAFSIRGSLNLTLGTAPERWIVGRSYELTWNTVGTISKIQLQYSKDDFQKDIHLIAENFDNHGTFTWAVPDDISNTVRVRIMDARYNEVSSVSGMRVIAGALQWLPFDQGVFTVNEPRTVRWKSSGTVPAVRLDYRENGSAEDWKLIAGSLENKDEFIWTVPDFIREGVVLRVSDVRDAVTSDVSAPFQIRGRLSVVQPAGGERWTVDDSRSVVWLTSGSIPEVVLDFSTDGFQKNHESLTSQPVANTGRFNWVVPDRISGQVQVRVRDARDSEVWGVSQPFSVNGAFMFDNPSGRVSWRMENPQVLTWKTSGSIPFVRLEYLAADTADGQERGALMAARLKNEGRFEWTIPSETPAKVRFRVSDAADSSVFYETPEPVRIFGVLNFTAPAETQRWTVGSNQDIVWTTRGFVPNVKLEFSRDGFKRDIQTIYPLVPNAGSVQWQVPDVVAPELWLRISDAGNPAVSAVTARPVSVHGALEVTSPLDGTSAQVGQKQEIAWKTIGTVPFVRLEYSTDGFTATRMTIAEKVPNTGRFSWDVPQAARQKISVAVSDDSDPAVFSVSRPFTVHGKLELVSPRGGEIWKVDDTASIQWETTGNVDYVKIEYSADEFISSDLIAARVENRGSFAWRVPVSVNQPVKIRISDADDPAVSSVTATALKVQGVFDFLAPQGGEFWIAGSEQSVLWQTRGNIPYASLEYSTDNFNSSIPVMLGFVNEGRFKWTVPDTAADRVQFRISDARDQSVSAVSAPVRIGGRLQLLSPSGELLRVGEETTVRWKSTGLIPKVRLEYSGDGFKQDVRVLQDSIDNPAEQGEFVWRVPDLISKDLQVRVSDVAHSDIYDVSAVPFKIAGSLRLTGPKAGETWPVGARRTLEWETNGSIPFVRLEYSGNNFVTPVPIDLHLANTGRYDWTVPDLSGQEIQFRVSDASDPAVADSTPFRVAVRGVLSLTSPLGDEVWQARSEHPITWTTTGTIPNVSLEYISALSPVPVKIADAVANTGSYVWTVPDKTLRAVKVRVSDSRSPMIYTESPVFEIRGSVNLNAPQGGEVWIAGTEHAILWNSTGSIEKVRLEYSVDQFNTIVPVALSLANEGRYQWRVPDAISRNARVRLSDASQPEVYSESRPFEIRGALTLINPIGGEAWAVGSRHPISWETTGTIPQVRIEYSTDDFRGDIQLISPATSNKGVYYWDIPALQANQIKVRVVDSSNPDVFDISRNPVMIAGDLDLIAPSNGETYRVGEKVQVRWRATPNIANVKLEYSADDFKTPVLISNYVPNTGSFDWNVPDRLSENLRLRISDAANSIVSATSKIPFRIQGVLKITSPAGDQVWTAGSRQRISWTTLGSIGKVRIEYSADDFKTSVPVAAGIENQGFFDWSVPELLNDIRIRVSDASVSAVQAVTDGKIHVAGRLELITPAAGERWIVGEERVIRWRVLGLMPKVDLEYSKDGFNKDVHLIAEGVSNFGSYAWKVPNDPADKVSVRIRSSSDAKVYDVSDAPFRIDFNHVTWSVRDARTGEHMVGLTLTDSTGKTRSALSSPTILDYPYGIYTTVWSKPGYGDFQSTWLADKDMTFTVSLNPEDKTPETVRFDFRYDAARDLAALRSWYEIDGASVSAVVKSEVKIYQGTELLKTLISTTPDSSGVFPMVWDTRQVAGNARYVASVSVTTADGRTLASPVSYQLDIPVKEFKEPMPRQSVSSVYLKPLALPASAPAVSRPAIQSSQEPVAPKVVEAPKPAPVREVPAAPKTPSVTTGAEFNLQAPSEAVMNETVSITYSGGRDSRPVLDVYDSNRRLILKAQSMTMQPDGRFVYLMPVKGFSFIPGKSVTVSVVDLASQQFKSVSIMIKSASDALGLDRQAGMISARELTDRLDQLIRTVQTFEKTRADWERVLPQIESGISLLAGSLTQPGLPEVVIDKVNELSQALAQLLQSRGYSSSFLANSRVGQGASARDLEGQIRLMQDAMQMLRHLYDSTISS